MARRRKRGSGSITRRADGLHVGQISLGATPDGKRDRRSFSSHVKGDVEFWLRETLRSVRVGEDPEDNRRTTGVYLELWLDEVGHGIRPGTKRGYKIHVDKWISPIIGRIPLVDLSPVHIRRVRDAVVAGGRSPRTAQSVLMTLRMALSQAERDGLVSRNVALGVRPPRQVVHKVTATSPDEAKAIMVAFEGHRLGPLVTVAIGTGLRLGELLGLRWTDVAGGTIRVTGAIRPLPSTNELTGYRLARVETKTRRSIRTLRPPALVVRALEDQRRRQAEAGTITEYVFATPHGTPLDPRNTTKSFQAQLAAAGLPRMRFHDLRHATATLMLAAGVPLRVIQEALGHENITTTAAVYAHVLPALQQDAADKLDEALSDR